MAAINFPASPITGDKLTNADSGITYEWQAAGYWKSIKYDVPELTPAMLCFRQVGPPPNDTTRLLHLFVPLGYEVDLSTFEYSLSANPSSQMEFDILVNNVRAADGITITTGGVVTVDDTRGPYTGPLELSIYYELGGTPDAGFGTFTLVAPVGVV